MVVSRDLPRLDNCQNPQTITAAVPFLAIPHGLSGKADIEADSRLHPERGAVFSPRELLQHVVQTIFQLDNTEYVIEMVLSKTGFGIGTGWSALATSGLAVRVPSC